MPASHTVTSFSRSFEPCLKRAAEFLRIIRALLNTQIVIISRFCFAVLFWVYHTAGRSDCGVTDGCQAIYRGGYL